MSDAMQLRIRKVMDETGMGEMQAFRHLQQRDYLARNYHNIQRKRFA